MASRTSAAEQLRRSVMTTMLWEDSFYEDGEAIADRIIRLTKEVSSDEARQIMLDAKRGQKLRHAPLLMAVAMAEAGWLKKDDLAAVIGRADELSEFLALYWKNGRRPIDHQVRKGLALAFRQFDEYQLAKYDRAKAVRLRDVLRMVRPKPENDDQAGLWGRLIRGELATPDTWEVALSAGSDKKEAFVRLMGEGKLGDLALIRNLRNMLETGVDLTVIKDYMSTRKWGRVLPFQFVAAARHAPRLEPEIEAGMLKSMEGMDRIEGRVTILVDGSGSMADPLSGKSQMSRFDAACGLAILAREICTDVEVFRFNNAATLVPARRGFALRDALGRAEGGTEMWKAVRMAGSLTKRRMMIVITDEQTQDSGTVADANADLVAIVNVAANQNGVGYGKGSVHISGWSENVVTFLREVLNAQMPEVR
jgi:hypothetical protein